jgi:spoIIIJ-associated protein
LPREIIETGKTVDAVIEEACQKLGCSREACDFEILDLPKRGFLGLHNTPAKVRVWVREEQSAQKSTPVSRPAPEKKQPAPPEKKLSAPPEKKQIVPEQGQPAAPKKPQPAPPPPKVAEPVPAKAPAETAPLKKYDRPRRESTSVLNPQKTQLAEDYLKSVLGELKLEAELVTRQEDNGVCIDINGKGLGVIIGRRGETLDAIQYLTSLVANRIDGDYMRITIDCGDYRLKRKETLEALARKLASQVLKTNVSRTLEPMNPFERRIIHATVSEIEGVTSTSTGEEPNRRVVITSPTAKNRFGRGGDRRDSGFRSGGGGYNRAGRENGNGGRGYRENHGNREGYGSRDNRGGRDNRDRRDNWDRGDRQDRASARPTPSTPPKTTPETTVEAGKLYTKIDLD